MGLQRLTGFSGASDVLLSQDGRVQPSRPINCSRGWLHPRVGGVDLCPSWASSLNVAFPFTHLSWDTGSP